VVLHPTGTNTTVEIVEYRYEVTKRMVAVAERVVQALDVLPSR
jgi:hypothetical protein